MLLVILPLPAACSDTQPTICFPHSVSLPTHDAMLVTVTLGASPYRGPLSCTPIQSPAHLMPPHISSATFLSELYSSSDLNPACTQYDTTLSASGSVYSMLLPEHCDGLRERREEMNGITDPRQLVMCHTRRPCIHPLPPTITLLELVSPKWMDAGRAFYSVGLEAGAGLGHSSISIPLHCWRWADGPRATSTLPLGSPPCLPRTQS